MATTSLNLRQHKFVFEGPGGAPLFAVQARVLGAAPEKLRSLFLVATMSGSGARERLVRVAAYKDLEAGLYPVNPLRAFQDPALTAVTPRAGDDLTILNPPPEWNVTSGPDPLTYRVEGADGPGRLLVSSSSPFPFASRRELLWELHRSGALIASGAAGWVARVLPAPTFLTDQVVVHYPRATEALDHIQAVQFAVKQLVNQAAFDAQVYLGAVNPINTTFTG